MLNTLLYIIWWLFTLLWLTILSIKWWFFASILVLIWAILIIPYTNKKVKKILIDKGLIKKEHLNKANIWWVFISIILWILFIPTPNDSNLVNENIKIADNSYITGVIDDKVNIIEVDNIVIDLVDEEDNVKLSSKVDIEFEKTEKVVNKYKVTKVIDWDTIDILYNWEEKRLRFIWMDTPENTTLRYWYVECYGEESKDYLYNLLTWKEVTLEFDESQWDEDIYWRMLVYIFLDWVNINDKLIKEWYAFEYTYNKPYKYINTFKSSQAYAKDNLIWLWAKSTCDWNRVIKIENNTIPVPLVTETEELKEVVTKEDCIIKWNISSKSKEKIYHRPWCQSYKQTKISVSKWERWFCTEQEAIDAGWRIAGNCN